ncbi:MAG: SsrA-binding protein [bacterium]|jgi:SsrA-binding protein
MVNRKVRFNYDILEEYKAGIVLIGSEVKSIKSGDVSVDGSYCFFKDGELFIKNMYVKPYESSRNDLDPRRDRKLLLKKKEIKKLQIALSEKGLTIIPLALKNEGRIKVIIGVGRGKKIYDKKETIKERDIKKQLKKNYEI